jgi:hypothetical protein
MKIELNTGLPAALHADKMLVTATCGGQPSMMQPRTCSHAEAARAIVVLALLSIPGNQARWVVTAAAVAVAAAAAAVAASNQYNTITG